MKKPKFDELILKIDFDTLNYKRVSDCILLGLVVILTITLLYSGFRGIKYFVDNRNIFKQIKEINEIVKVLEVEDTEKTEIIINEGTSNENGNLNARLNIVQSNPYRDYVKQNLIDVDITDLKEKNDETKGWIQVNGTNINYPFVQGTDNSFYLNHSFDNSKNSAGWVFVDYRNNLVSLDRNTIIYAHGRLDKTMFGTLKNILTSGWLKKPENFVVKMSTESENTLWQVFSIYHIPTTSDYIKTSFSSDKDFKEFTDMLLDRSAYNFQTSLDANDKILTLSTCYNSNEKVVLHAKLIKREVK